MNSKLLLQTISRDLSRRLEQLCDRLAELRDRLRSSVAEVIGQVTGGAIRDAILSVLDNGARVRPVPASPARWSFDRQWHDENPDDPWTDEPDLIEDLADQETSRAPFPSRINAALAAGLQTLACFLRRRLCAGLLVPATVAVLAGCVAYAMPQLAVVSLGLIGLQS